jgi:nucleotide-binding universal stress UspA family protein
MYFRILAAIDGSPQSERALREAIGLAVALGSDLVLLHVVEDMRPLLPGELASRDDGAHQRALADFGHALLQHAANAAAEAGAKAEPVQREARRVNVARTILDEAAARECGLIVLGSHGRRGLTPLPLGGDADGVIASATMPVLVVR